MEFEWNRANKTDQTDAHTKSPEELEADKRGYERVRKERGLN